MNEAQAYRGGGLSDWRLPTKDELNSLYAYRVEIGGFYTGANAFYWSSTERSSFDVWDQNFQNGVQDFSAKANGSFARPVRAF